MALIVKSSSLHGAGVYTTAPVKKGIQVLEYTGPRLTAKACEGMNELFEKIERGLRASVPVSQVPAGPGLENQFWLRLPGARSGK